MRRNDDGGDGLNSRISRSLPAGTYTIEATTYATGATGAFTLTLQANGGGTQPTNSPATGAPTVTGTAQVGQTLTADTSAIADADGLANVSFSYQWIRNDGSSDTDITGATDSTHSLDDADEGKTIKVKVGSGFATTGVRTRTSRELRTPPLRSRPTGRGHHQRTGPGSSYWFQVRARNAHSSSDWSDYRQVGSTNQSSLGKRARPDNVGQWRACHQWHGAGRREPHRGYDGNRGRKRSGPGAVPVPMGIQRWERRR